MRPEGREFTMKAVYLFGPYRLDPARRSLLRHGAEVVLGSRAFDTLVAIVEGRGAIVSPREIMAKAWGGLVVGDSNVRVQIANLRKALGCGKDGGRYIASVAGRGYCFVADIEQVRETVRVAGNMDLVRVA